jgi:hypothetical protein
MWELDPGSTLGVRVGIEVVSECPTFPWFPSCWMYIVYGYPHPVRMRSNPILTFSAKVE